MQLECSPHLWTGDGQAFHMPSILWLVGWSGKHQSALRSRVKAFQQLQHADVGVSQLLLTHSWSVRSQALLSAAAADDWLHPWSGRSQQLLRNLPHFQQGRMELSGLMTLKGCVSSLVSLGAGSKCCLPAWPSRDWSARNHLHAATSSVEWFRKRTQGVWQGPLCLPDPLGWRVCLFFLSSSGYFSFPAGARRAHAPHAAAPTLQGVPGENCRAVRAARLHIRESSLRAHDCR